MKIQPFKAVSNACKFIVDCHQSSHFKPAAYAIDACAIAAALTVVTITIL